MSAVFWRKLTLGCPPSPPPLPLKKTTFKKPSPVRVTTKKLKYDNQNTLSL